MGKFWKGREFCGDFCQLFWEFLWKFSRNTGVTLNFISFSVSVFSSIGPSPSRCRWTAPNGKCLISRLSAGAGKSELTAGKNIFLTGWSHTTRTMTSETHRSYYPRHPSFQSWICPHFEPSLRPTKTSCPRLQEQMLNNMSSSDKYLDKKIWTYQPWRKGNEWWKPMWTPSAFIKIMKRSSSLALFLWKWEGIWHT